MVTCSSCSTELTVASPFCPFCGAPVDVAAAATFAGSATAGRGSGALIDTPARPSTPISSPQPETRFLPGAVIAGRYRIVALLGEGGMGEVYRADDLKLGHAVALKFLPAGRSSDPESLARFHAEVRLARQISHPNVCRIHDIAEIDGEHFLSMEYVDGEDLASLLRRIGRLPQQKALDIARQLCAGLAAAHENGVLHRDLKPANVMLDGRGRVRITDFGIAGRVDAAPGHELLGTPAYMAPEQLAGAAATQATDIYALGLVLYETFTGQPGFKSRTVIDRLVKRDATPSTLSSIVADVDPVVERVILRCLAPNPEDRPASVIAIASALPGGDPLAAALAAGETPSPELVAAAGEVGALQPLTAWSLLLAVLVSFATIAWLADSVAAIRMVSLEKSPEAMSERARQVTARAGYGAAADTAHGFEENATYTRFVLRDSDAASRRRVLATGPAFAYVYWERQSPQPLVPSDSSGVVTFDDPPHTAAGMVRILLDGRGQLMRFEAVPDTNSPDRRPAPDWSVMFSEAGLPMAAFSQAAPARIPPVYADTRSAWEGVYPGRPDLSVRVEAAALGSKPVYFDVSGPWSTGNLQLELATAPLPFVISSIVAIVLALGVGGILARRNLRLGRGDAQGATRLAVSAFLILNAAVLLTIDHVAAVDEAGLLFTAVSQSLFYSALLWIAYVALEPFVRRRWPHLITSWTRLLAGKWRDPLVGRDVLIGVVGSAGAVALIYVIEAVAQTFGWLPPMPLTVIPALLHGLGNYVGELLFSFAGGVFRTLVTVLLLLLLIALFRRWWIAAGTLYVVMATMVAMGTAEFLTPFAAIAASAISTFLLLRFGILAAAVQSALLVITLHSPITFDTSAWYSSLGFLLIAVCVALAAYGFWISLAGQPVFGRMLLDES